MATSRIPRRTAARLGPRCLVCAVALAATPAVARSLPKAEPAPKAQACPEVGDGYVRIPGSGTCVKVGGDVRVEVMRQGGGGASGSGDR